jgi:hypothetical protein
MPELIWLYLTALLYYPHFCQLRGAGRSAGNRVA